jgi:hypothetical protein
MSCVNDLRSGAMVVLGVCFWISTRLEAWVTFLDMLQVQSSWASEHGSEGAALWSEMRLNPKREGTLPAAALRSTCLFEAFSSVVFP